MSRDHTLRKEDVIAKTFHIVTDFLSNAVERQLSSAAELIMQPMVWQGSREDRRKTSQKPVQRQLCAVFTRPSKALKLPVKKHPLYSDEPNSEHGQHLFRQLYPSYAAYGAARTKVFRSLRRGPHQPPRHTEAFRTPGERQSATLTALADGTLEQGQLSSLSPAL